MTKCEDMWQRIDTAQRNGDTILVSDGVSVDSAYWDYGDWCAPHSLANGLPYEPMYWRPMPKVPIEGRK